jgi:hypothetical protein
MKITFLSGNTLFSSTLAGDERSLCSPAYMNSTILTKENSI